jgi:hypothetical protein
VSPEFSTGSSLSISESAISKYAQGAHAVAMVARFPDSVVKTVWHFRYFKTMYKEIRAQMIIDSSWHSNDGAGAILTFTRYKLLSVLPADSLIFGNAISPNDTSRLLSYDTAAIMREYISRKDGLYTLASKDTVDCIILEILRGVPDYNEWLDPVPIASFLNQTTPPFPISQALHFFSIYASNNNIAKRSNSQKGDFKLGPIFNLYAGDPGWSLTASNDASHWYLIYKLGDGDCPSGCTEWEVATYRISADGTVQKVITGSESPFRAIPSRKVANAHGQQCYFTVNGQHLQKDLHSSPKASGVLIVLNKGNFSKRSKIAVLP